MFERNLIIQNVIYRIKKKKDVVYLFELIFYQWLSQVQKQLFPILLPKEQKQTFKDPPNQIIIKNLKSHYSKFLLAELQPI